MSPEMFSRIDDARAQTGAAKVSNTIVRPRGTVARRPGFEFVAATKDETKRTRLVPFKFSATQALAVEIGEGYFRFYSQQAVVLASPRAYVPSATVTFTSGASGNVTWTGHGLQVNDPLRFSTTGTFPTAFASVSPTLAGTTDADVYVKEVVDANTVRLSLTVGGSLMTYASAGSGTHTGHFSYAAGTTVVSGGDNFIALLLHINVVPVDGATWYEMPATGELELPNSYTESEILEIKYTQSLDILTLVHPSHPVSELRRLGVDSWTFSEVSFAPQVGTPSIFSGGTGAVVGQSIAVNSLTAASPSVITTTTAHGFVAALDTVYLTDTIGTITAGFYVVNTTPTTTTLTLKEVVGGNLVGSGATTPTTGKLQPSSLSTTVTHNYRVTAINGDGLESDPSTVATVDNNLNAPGASNTVAWYIVQDAAKYRVYKEQGGRYGVVGEVDASESNPTQSFTDDNIAPDMSVTLPFFDTSLGSVNPGAVGHYEQRRVFGSGQDVWMTVTGTESDLSYHLPVIDTDRISFGIAALTQLEVEHIVPMAQLLILTSEAEFRVTPLNSDAITPTSISIRPQTFVGSSKTRPVIINNTVLFEEARGGHLRELGFSADAGGFITGDLSMRAQHLFDGETLDEMAFMRTPYPIVWACSSSGKLLGFTYSPEEEIGAWHQHSSPDSSVDTIAAFESCCVIPEGDEDRLYVIVRRDIFGTVHRYVECMATQLEPNESDEFDFFYLDSFLRYDDVSTTTISGLDHLEGADVTIASHADFATDIVVQTATVISGSVTLTTAVENAIIGIAYESEVQTMPLAMAIDGYGQGRTKNITSVALRLQGDGKGIQAAQVANTLRYLDRPEPSLLFTQSGSMVRRVTVEGKWDENGFVRIVQSEPRPMVVGGITVAVEAGG